MPRVPTYQGPQVQSTALQGGFQQGANSDAAFGGVQGRQLEALGQGMQRLDAGMQQVFEKRAVAEADEADAEITSGWLQWDAENRAKFTGKNAGGYGAAAKEWWDKTAQTYGEKLSPLAKQRISAALMRKRGTALAGATGFDATEVERHADNVAESSINASIQMGVSTGDTATAALEVRRVAGELATRKNWDDKQTTDYVRGKLDAMHGAHVTALAAENAAAAAQYLDNAIARNEVSAVRTAQLRKAVEAAANEQEGQKLARSWAALPYEDRLAKASEIKDPQTRKAAEATIDQDQARIDRANRVQTERVKGQLELEYQKTGRMPSAAKFTALEQLDPGAAADVLKAIKADMRARAKEGRGESIKTDWDTYTKLRNLPPEEFVKLNLREHIDKLAGPQLEQLLDLQDRYRKPDKESEARTSEQQLSAFTKTLGLKDKKLGQFQSAYGDELAGFIKKNNRQPSYEERQKLLDGLVMVQKDGWFSDTLNYEVGTEQRVRPGTAPATTPAPARSAPKVGTVVQISGSDRSLITQALRAEGIPVTEDNIQARYRLAKGN